MVELRKPFTQWSTLEGLLNKEQPQFMPEWEHDRIKAYDKYDQMYWNDPRQYTIRVLEGESPIYVPTSRVVVDTTAHFLAKNLHIHVSDHDNHLELDEALHSLLNREAFYSRFHTAKQVGVARGDFVYHMTASPTKLPTTRISLVPVDPRKVVLEHDPDDRDRVVQAHILSEHYEPNDPQMYLRKLSYWYEGDDDTAAPKAVWHAEGIYKTSTTWWTEEGFDDVLRWVIPPGPMDSRTPAIPLYHFKNLDWAGQHYGSSELRGLEYLGRAISQGSTDTQMTLSLEGLGVYATDGGRPVNDEGQEVDWEVFPGRVMEVPSGSYFRRVEGVGSITPMMDQLSYLEKKIFMASGLSDVALGQVDVATAASGVALAIKFMPTLAKLEQRDTAAIDKLRQMFHDWTIWHWIYEGQQLEGEVEPALGDKLPASQTEEINALNNMLDRGVISKAYYRERMMKYGHIFPDDIEEAIIEEKEKEAELAALNAPPGLQENAAGAATGVIPPPANPNPRGSRARNASRVNESNGTEA